MSFTLGADPELFMADATGGLISAIDRIGGTKQFPRPLPIGDGCAVQEDNVAVEFNIPPSASKVDFSYNINKVLNHLSEMVAQQGLHFVNQCSASFPIDQILDPRAMEFGCDPDFNAWTGKRNPRPNVVDKTFRTCGGHVHVGHKFKTKKEATQFIKYMDMMLGVPSIVMDEDTKRRDLYGKWGCYRIKPYGVEYRTLSNFWVFDDKYQQWVWDATEMAMDAWQNNKIDVDSEREVIDWAINHNNREAATNLINKYNLLVA